MEYTEFLLRDQIATQRKLIQEHEGKHFLGLVQVRINRALIDFYKELKKREKDGNERALLDKRLKAASDATSQARQEIDEVTVALPLLRLSLAQLEAQLPQEPEPADESDDVAETEDSSSSDAPLDGNAIDLTADDTVDLALQRVISARGKLDRAIGSSAESAKRQQRRASDATAAEAEATPELATV